MIFHCKWVIFHCYVKYPEGMGHLSISNLMIFLGFHCWICPSYPHEGWCSNPFPMLNTPQPKPGVSINTIGSMHFGAHLTGERMGCPWNSRNSAILGTKRSSYPYILPVRLVAEKSLPKNHLSMRVISCTLVDGIPGGFLLRIFTKNGRNDQPKLGRYGEHPVEIGNW